MMMMSRASNIIRAYPVSDTWENVRIGQGLPGFGRSRLNKLVRVRVGTLNVGSMTGRGRELAEKGRSVQESRWKGNKASELGGYCKLLYRGADERGRNGVGMALSKKKP